MNVLRIEDCKPGTLVQCINNAGANDSLTYGAIYTVREVLLAHQTEGGNTGIGLEEVSPGLGGFFLWRFRLLPGDRLEVFRKMLVPTEYEEMV